MGQRRPEAVEADLQLRPSHVSCSARLAAELSAGTWRSRRHAAGCLVQTEVLSQETGCQQAVEVVLPLLDHARWRTRAIAKLALRRMAEEAPEHAAAAAFELLDPSSREMEAAEAAEESPEESSGEFSEKSPEALGVACDDLNDRTLADVAIPAQIPRSPRSEGFCTWSSSDDVLSCKESDLHNELSQQPPASGALLSALSAMRAARALAVADAELPASAPVVLQLRAARAARRLLAGGGPFPAAAVSLLGDFGGTGDLAEFRRLGIAADPSPEVCTE
ncbi:unnamed protein product [Symbiodinium natans]|uniref:Uncharacterized protein n=1 Tax=Symbiodinium natans TaxID=878477 RepID=A0A812S9U7_9DINO|nr:unnamed protein product [Symbiodinium natans]